MKQFFWPVKLGWFGRA